MFTISFETQLAKVEDETLIHRDLVGIFEEDVEGSDSAGDAYLIYNFHIILMIFVLSNICKASFDSRCISLQSL